LSAAASGRYLQLAGASEDAATAYLAAMFTGALHERSLPSDSAEEAYQMAIARLPASRIIQQINSAPWPPTFRV
jgi:hypothetical protein